MRVEPAITSGPTCGTMAISAASARGEAGSQVIAIVRAPTACASTRLPSVKGV